MVRTLRALFVRHGESEDNAGLPSESMASTPLTPTGRRQAEALAAQIETAPARFVVSPYVRAQQTSAPARARFPGVPVEEWAVEEFTFLPASAYHGTTLSQRQSTEDGYWQANDPRVVLGDGAESFDAFFARVEAARERLEALQSDSVMVFSHKKVVTALMWSWLAGVHSPGALRMARFRSFDHSVELPNCARVEVRIEDGRAWLGRVRTLQPTVPAG